jgi:glycosyltransferase involved in cell wall biosynthesis
VPDVTIAHLAVVMPAYNEADGIGGFLTEVLECVTPLADRVSMLVADDRSTDGTAAAIASLALPQVQVLTQPTNRGHGPTALAAYRAGLATDAEVIVHVDGDGQFAGADFPRLLGALEREDVDIVHGVRRGRDDPWYRRALTGTLRVVVRPFAGRGIPDINTPLRAYRREALEALIDAVGSDAVVPHVHFSLLEARARMAVRYLPVRSLPRRGDSASGTMWQAASTPALPPPRLRAFVREAASELWRLSIAPSAPLRRAARELRG